jgi:hypothetical protein
LGTNALTRNPSQWPNGAAEAILLPPERRYLIFFVVCQLLLIRVLPFMSLLSLTKFLPFIDFMLLVIAGSSMRTD